jgi:hypothetical protein
MITTIKLSGDDFKLTTRLYPINLEIDRDSLLSCIVLHIDIDREGRLRARLYDKRDDFNFSIV